MSIVAVVPLKFESSRLPNKNTRDFAGIYGGLTTIKIGQLLQTDGVEKILVSTTDKLRAKDLISFSYPITDKIVISERRIEFQDRDLPTNLLHECVLEQLESYNIDDRDTILWAQVTNPLFTARRYEEALDVFYSLTNYYDALQSVTAHKHLCRTGSSPNAAVNWNPNLDGNWPRSQKLHPVYLIDSACSIIRFDKFKESGDRIGKFTYWYESPGISGWDIDTLDEFKIAEVIYNSKYWREWTFENHRI